MHFVAFPVRALCCEEPKKKKKKITFSTSLNIQCNSDISYRNVRKYIDQPLPRSNSEKFTTSLTFIIQKQTVSLRSFILLTLVSMSTSGSVTSKSSPMGQANMTSGRRGCRLKSRQYGLCLVECIK